MHRKLFLYLWLFFLPLAMPGQTMEELDIPEVFQSVQAKALRYWFDDDDAGMQTVNGLSGIYSLDVSALSDGLHVLHYQVTGVDGIHYGVAAQLFLKLKETVEPLSSATLEGSKLNYWYDNDTEKIQKARNLSEVQILDVSALNDDIHTVHYQLVGSKGTIFDEASGVFVKMEQNMGEPPYAPTATKLRYWFNQETASTIQTDVADGVSMIDVSTLPSGLNVLCYQLVYEDGHMAPTVTGVFLKKDEIPDPISPNGITRYKYWLNDISATTMQTVTLDEVSNPYMLMALLPVPQVPVRSSAFQFQINNGVPMLYAKNDLHVRFYDDRDYFVDDSKSYIDYSVSQTVEPVGELQDTQEFDRVAEDAIRWYTVELEEGDSVAFKSNQACTIQLFSPSGEEVYSALGSTSVTLDGCHTWENGTYYLAVHDVMGSQSRMNLEYLHMDKYDVVGQDIANVGDGGCSTITFSGNGFRNLGSVELYNAAGDRIESLAVGHESDASTSVMFDFTNANIGKYDAVFHFSEEDKEFAKLLTVEEATDIELALEVTYPNRFLRGSGYTTYTAKISNAGNMTSYRTPIYIHISTLKKDGVSCIKTSGLDLPRLFGNINREGFTTEDFVLMDSIAEKYGDTHYFVHTEFFDENTGDSVYNWSAYFFTDIAPLSSNTITVNVFTTDSVNVWFTLPESNNPLALSDQLSSAKRRANAQRRRSFSEGICCMREQVECFASILADAASIANLISDMVPGNPAQLVLEVADCVAGSFNQVVSATGEVMCGKNDVQATLYEKVSSIMNGISIASTLTTCVTNLLPANKVRKFLKAFDKLFSNEYMLGLGLGWDIGDCVNEFRKPKPNCPPHPKRGGGTSEPVNSFDPNDIYGYTSEAGSKFIANGVEKVNYTIEFENDPEFATASAHTVVVKDTLNSTYFDLSSYKPTAIMIGDKRANLDGNPNFVTTVDMRPAIYAIAQVEGKFDKTKGVATWTFTSLDPMTMEPTDDVMQGFLPVNNNGISGIGEVMYDINLKHAFDNGTEIPNRAGIMFDENDIIMTPTWVNTVDAVAPTSHVSACEIKNDTTATLRFESEDNLSGVWKYDVYVQYEENASWYKAAEGVTKNECDVRIYEGINHGFYVVATDSAGNVEAKEAAREYTLDLFEPTEDSDLELELAEGWNWISHNLNTSVDLAAVKAKALRIQGQEEETIKDATLGFVGDLTELKPTLGYKIQMEAADEIPLEGKLFNASYKSISLSEGWNWIGYPLAHEMEIAQALEHFTPEEGDYIIGQDDFTQYADGAWVGTLSTLTPGLAYLYKSGSTKQMFFNSTVTLSSRVESRRRVSLMENPWNCDKRKYPNVMAVTACLYNNDMIEDADDYYVAAFCGNECRGVGKNVKGLVMMTVYGQGNETISFKAIDKETEQLVDIAESTTFSADVQGSIAAPFRMTLGGNVATGITDLANAKIKITPAVVRNTMTVEVPNDRIDRLTVTNTSGAVVASWKKLANGSTVDVSSLSTGVYIVTVKAGKQEFSKKFMKVTD